VRRKAAPREAAVQEPPVGLACRIIMKRKHLRFGKGFRVVFGNHRGNAAEMVIPPGESEGDARNRHPGADQWLFVVEGTGRALVNGKNYLLRAGSLVLIEAGDWHQIKNTGRDLLKTLNLYTPPGYNRAGNPLSRARP
jgi:mannose-6-phosphate isomerase-like protein (cupin superfamily)